MKKEKKATAKAISKVVTKTPVKKVAALKKAGKKSK